MSSTRKVTGTASSIPAGLALGGFTSLVLTAAGSALTAYLILSEQLPEAAVGYCALMILLLSSAAGAWIAVKRIKHRRLFVCGLSAAVYYGILLSITALFFGGQYQGMGVTALTVLGGAGAVALLGANGTPSGRRWKHKARHW